MNYKETVAYLYKKVPSFQRVGQAAYKEGLENTLILDKHFGNPSTFYKTIHIAGTNGKGSCAHTIAAVLQEAGYKVGLYTSPHLLDFRERIRVNGIPVSEQYIVDFIEKEHDFIEPLFPSFFELTTSMAFQYFKEEKVDIAVIEVGLGGRLDCTNIISPILSVITNISYDHMQFLGSTLSAIAGEKAGIIKQGVPVIIGEAVAETKPVFEAKAQDINAPIYFAQDNPYVLSCNADYVYAGCKYQIKGFGQLYGELGGFCQERNTNTIFYALMQLKNMGIGISDENIRKAFASVCELTGLMGRWQKISEKPTVICDTGHNEGGFFYISKQLRAQRCHQLRIVFGMVNDKDINAVLNLLPKDATYYFTKAQIERSMNEKELEQMAAAHGLSGKCFEFVDKAFECAKQDADAADFIYVGGSSYVVADFLASFRQV